MSAAEGNGLGAERLAELMAKVIAHHHPVFQHESNIVVDCDCYPESDEANGIWEHGLHVANLALAAIWPELDRLTRERDEAREVVGRVRVAMSNHPDPCAKHPEDEDGDTACGWKRAYTDVRAALDDDRASGRNQAARPSSTPKRPSEHLTSADEGPHFDDAAWIRDRLEPARSVEWTFDGPAVRPNEHNDEESDR